MFRLPGITWLAAGLLAAAPAVHADSTPPSTAPTAPTTPLVLPLTPDVPDGYLGRVGRFDRPLRQDLGALSLRPLDGGRYELRFVPEGRAPGLPAVDLRPFVPRIPRLAQGNPALVRLALIQRELNRNQTRYPLPDGSSLFLANNCLRQGLWEVGLERKDGSASVTTFHAWLSFPQAEYARLFEQVNGEPYAPYAELLAGYPTLDHLPIPLDALRSVLRDTAVPGLTNHRDQPVERFAEQERKAALVVAPAARTYADWTVQPITTAKFSEPGVYTPADPVHFDLAWLAQPADARLRRVRSPRGGEDFSEVEIRFANGYRLLLADRRLDGLAPRPERPQEGDALRLTFGIGTPDIYSGVEERDRELAQETAGYLLLLDGKGENVDNHKAGLDRVYLWREAGSPGRLHLHLVGYERILLAAHLSLPWSGENEARP